MFSWSKKKETRRRGKPDSEENEFGIKLDKGPSDKQLEAELRALAGVDALPEDDLNLNEGEEDEEAELLRLIGGGKGKRPAKKAATPGETLGDISADITADIEDVGDEDVEIDENDPELLGELLELTQPDDVVEDEPESESDTEAAPVPSGEGDVLGTLKERLKMYKAAEAKAKESNESSRARRFSRGIKTLEDLIKKAKGGKPVSPNDIPPVIAMNLKPAPPVQPEAPPENPENSENLELENEEGEEEEDSEVSSPPPPPPTLSPEETLKTLMERLKLYETAEAKAKESGETTRARRFNRGIKTIQSLIKEAKAGKPIAPNDIPPVVALNLKPAPPPPPPSEDTGFENAEEDNEEDEMGNINFSSVPSEDSSPKVEETEQNIFDVLTERLNMYKTAEAKAKESGESTRARRFNRGIKTIQDLIKQATAGKPISPDDIPPPIALNLKPAPLVVQSEEEPRDAAVESDTLVKSPNIPVGPPLKFSAVDDIDDDLDLEEELFEDYVPETVLEGLEQRIRIYTRLKEKAQEEGNDNLIDQNEKIISIYLNAIKTYKNGGYIDVLGLPAPRGAPPIPIPFQIP